MSEILVAWERLCRVSSQPLRAPAISTALCRLPPTAGDDVSTSFFFPLRRATARGYRETQGRRPFSFFLFCPLTPPLLSLLTHGSP